MILVVNSLVLQSSASKSQTVSIFGPFATWNLKAGSWNPPFIDRFELRPSHYSFGSYSRLPLLSC
ncbi:hypothetical protein BDW59DRAFT_102455 [Aspergillus cavernicola]|uniref:Uncharacterized protein n=1 Tax=Aspergillus cavernicola TaxID=176166 RepID=A0ABR4I4U3_9EURO